MKDKCVSCEAQNVETEATEYLDGMPLCSSCKEDYLLEMEMFYDEDED
jgi:NAD-dependent SIR2 family protein deacetylase